MLCPWGNPGIFYHARWVDRNQIRSRVWTSYRFRLDRNDLTAEYTEYTESENIYLNHSDATRFDISPQNFGFYGLNSARANRFCIYQDRLVLIIGIRGMILAIIIEINIKFATAKV